MRGPTRTVLLIAASASCLTATGADAIVYTEVDCSVDAPVSVIVGRDLHDLDARMGQGVVSATKRGCGSDSRVGDFVLAPQEGSTGSIAFAVMTRPDGQSPDLCGAPHATGCIVAKRWLGFAPHEVLTVRTDLRLSCLNIECPADATCVRGNCVVAKKCTTGCDESSLTPGGSGLTTLASGQNGPSVIAVDGKNVYWTNTPAGEVAMCAVGGCGGKPTLVASSRPYPQFIAVGAGNVYWTESGGVAMCAVAGCGGAPTSLGGSVAVFLAVDATNVYWSESCGGGPCGDVVSCAVGGCGGNPTTIGASQPDPNGVAVDATNVYWTNIGDNSVVKCSKAGCGGSPSLLANGQSTPVGIAVDATSVYWTNAMNETVMKCAVGGCANHPTTIASGQTQVGGIAVDATSVYWANGTSVMKCSVDGCAGNPTTLASGQKNVTDIAIDDTSIYWTDTDMGTVMKLTPK